MTQPILVEAQQCPGCDVWSTGGPVTHGILGTQAQNWKYRMDLKTWVCEDCHKVLEEDKVREELLKSFPCRKEVNDDEQAPASELADTEPTQDQPEVPTADP